MFDSYSTHSNMKVSGNIYAAKYMFAILYVRNTEITHTNKHHAFKKEKYLFFYNENCQT